MFILPKAIKQLSAACKCLYDGIKLAYKQTVWTQTRLLFEEQTDLFSHCLLHGRF